MEPSDEEDREKRGGRGRYGKMGEGEGIEARGARRGR